MMLVCQSCLYIGLELDFHEHPQGRAKCPECGSIQLVPQEGFVDTLLEGGVADLMTQLAGD